ncbi:hypothetical protein [Aureimonas psammosilenae]|uniref:hypothetical protein n=1 Tax=Aureimonas psammosilenae TaxID=2495496 RepID=UPI00126119BF|nr:hypothetical protein [Aureimonas psammosilenae]
MTSYVTFCYLDAGTGVPANVQPQMLNGQRAPNGVTWGFSLESRWPIGSKNSLFDICYGTTNGKTDIPGILSVITKADYDAAQAVEIAAREAIAKLATFIPVPMLRQRIEKLGMWEDFGAYLAQNPAEMLKVLTLEGGVDPAYPAIIAAFEAMSVPQVARDYILASPSVGVPDVQFSA